MIFFKLNRTDENNIEIQRLSTRVYHSVKLMLTIIHAHCIRYIIPSNDVFFSVFSDLVENFDEASKGEGV